MIKLVLIAAVLAKRVWAYPAFIAAMIGFVLYEALAAVTGHKSLKEVERYTREADQLRLAREAVNLVDRKE